MNDSQAAPAAVSDPPAPAQSTLHREHPLSSRTSPSKTLAFFHRTPASREDARHQRLTLARAPGACRSEGDRVGDRGRVAEQGGPPDLTRRPPDHRPPPPPRRPGRCRLPGLRAASFLGGLRPPLRPCAQGTSTLALDFVFYAGTAC
jgi:hypothetical protein